MPDSSFEARSGRPSARSRHRNRWPRNAVIVVAAAAMIASACSDRSDSGTVTDDRPTSSEVSGDGQSAASTPADVDFTIDISGAELAATVSERFQSFNLEMASVVGGTFRAPRNDPSGELMSVHPPVELDERLTNLTSQLGPAYLRVSGSWANNTYFDDTGRYGDEPAEGFKAVLSGERWREVSRFAEATDNRLVSSLAVGQGTRAPDGSWTPDLASRFLR